MTNSPTIDSDMAGDENNSQAPMHGGNGASSIGQVLDGGMAGGGGGGSSGKRVSRKRRGGRGQEAVRGTELFSMMSVPPPAPPSSPLPVKRGAVRDGRDGW